MAQLPLIRFTSGNGIKNHFSHSRHDPEPSAQDRHLHHSRRSSIRRRSPKLLPKKGAAKPSSLPVRPPTAETN